MTTDTTQQESQTEVNTAIDESTTTEQPRIELIDLINCRLCLQLMTRRGAVLPSEMEGFGRVYNNINTFLKKMAPGSVSLEDPSTLPKDDTKNTEESTLDNVVESSITK